MKNIAEFIVMLLFSLVLVACSTATVEETAVSSTTNTLLPAREDHSHALDEPEHLHLDDGSTLTTAGAASLQEDIWALLQAGDPIAVGVANESVETAVFTIPTMF